METLEKQVKAWMSLDDDIKELKAQIKPLDEQKKMLTETIMESMKNHDASECVINDKKLKLCTTKTSATINKELIQDMLDEFFKVTDNFSKMNKETKISKIVDYIYTERPVTEKNTIRRVKA